MSALIQQIKTAYDINGMSPEEISQEFNMDVVSVKAALSNCSQKYRDDTKTTPDLDFSDDQLSIINNTIFEIAQVAQHSDGSVDYKTRLAAATYIRDDKKGRKEVRKMAENTNMLLQFNMLVQNARQVADEAKRKVIEA